MNAITAFQGAWRSFVNLVTVLAAALAAASCATPPAGPTSNEAELPLDEAVAFATDSLIAQTKKGPAFLANMDAKLNRKALVIDPMLEGGSGQQTALTRLLEDKVSARLRSTHPQFDLLPFQSANLAKSHYLITGTITRIMGAKADARAPFQLHVAMTDLKTGIVAAQASSRVKDDGLDTRPTPYYSDSPVLVKDNVVDGYIRTSETAAGQRADAAYFERVATATLINEGTLAYNAGRYTEALDLYNAALTTPAGEQLRSLNGAYLASWKLGRTTEAEQAFGRVVAHGIANRSLGVKFLFNPRTTDFWPDPKVSAPYPIWLRQIARQAQAAKICMNVVGHTSRTGSEPYNDKLSEQRAMAIRQKLGAESPELMPRLKASGVGFRENLIGIGTDDASDALDRRVEFRMVGC